MLTRILGTGALSRRVGHAGIWTLIGFGSGNDMRLISNLILTRLLSPEIFGLMALAQVFMNGITMLSDVGVKASVIRSERGEDPMFLQTAWSVQIIRGAIVMGICWLIAWPASLAYDQPILFPLLCVLAVTALIKGFSSISILQSSRKLLLKPLIIMSGLGRLLTMVVTIFMAWQLQSVWALAIGAFVGGLIQVALSHVMLPPFRHRFSLEPGALREITQFGRWILLGTFFTFLGNRGQQAMFGFVVPVEVVGLIAIAMLLAQIPNQLFTKLIGNVLFPSFSEILRERPQHLPRALRKARLFTIGVAFPMLFAMAFLAQPIVDLLYDDRYQAASVILAFSALNGAVPLLSNTYQNLLLAEGRSGVHAVLMFVWASSMTLGIFLGFSVAGLIGSLVGIAAATTLMFLINTGIAMRRGYATGLLDWAAFALVVVVYAGLLWGMDIPPAFLSPERVGEIMQ